MFLLFQAGCLRIQLHVKTDNVAAIQFYKTKGFYAIAFKDSFYFIDNAYHDAYEMIFDFPPNSKITCEDDLEHYMKPTSSDITPDAIIDKSTGNNLSLWNSLFNFTLVCGPVLLADLEKILMNEFIFIVNEFFGLIHSFKITTMFLSPRS